MTIDTSFLVYKINDLHKLLFLMYLIKFAQIISYEYQGQIN